MTQVYISSHPSTHPPSHYDLLFPVFLLHFFCQITSPQLRQESDQTFYKPDAQESSSQASSERSPSPFAASKATCKVWSWEAASEEPHSQKQVLTLCHIKSATSRLCPESLKTLQSLNHDWRLRPRQPTSFFFNFFYGDSWCTNVTFENIVSE